MEENWRFEQAKHVVICGDVSSRPSTGDIDQQRMFAGRGKGYGGEGRMRHFTHVGTKPDMLSREIA